MMMIIGRCYAELLGQGFLRLAANLSMLTESSVVLRDLSLVGFSSCIWSG